MAGRIPPSPPYLCFSVIYTIVLNKGAPVVTSCLAGSSILDPSVSNTCVDNQIARFLTFYQLPNAGLIGNGDTGFFAFAGQQAVPENYGTGRGDIKISNKDNLNVNYYFDHSLLSQLDATNNVLTGFEVGRQGGSLEETKQLHWFRYVHDRCPV